MAPRDGRIRLKLLCSVQVVQLDRIEAELVPSTWLQIRLALRQPYRLVYYLLPIGVWQISYVLGLHPA